MKTKQNRIAKVNTGSAAYASTRQINDVTPAVMTGINNENRPAAPAILVLQPFADTPVQHKISSEDVLAWFTHRPPNTHRGFGIND